MSNYWKEFTAGIAIIIATIVTVCLLMGIPVLFINNWSMGILLLIALGIIVFIVLGLDYISESMNASILASFIGVVTGLIALNGFLFNNESMYLLLTAILITFWTVIILTNIREKLYYAHKKGKKKLV